MSLCLYMWEGINRQTERQIKIKMGFWDDPHKTTNTRRHGLNDPSASTMKKERPTTFNNSKHF